MSSESTTTTALAEVWNVSKWFGPVMALNGVSLEIGPGITGLVGPNGAGKTTTFYSIAGFIRPDEGRILLDDEDLTGFPIHKRAKKGLSYLPQDPSVFKKLTVQENVRIILETMNLSRKKIRERALDMMTELNIVHLADNRAGSLSGGERRRVEIMRAMATRPRFILLDEPFAGIDPLAIADLQEIIIGLKNKGLGVLISDHNVRETLTVCDYAYIVNNGKILIQGTAEEIINSDTARKMYLGENFIM